MWRRLFAETELSTSDLKLARLDPRNIWPYSEDTGSLPKPLTQTRAQEKQSGKDRLSNKMGLDARAGPPEILLRGSSVTETHAGLRRFA